MTRLLFENSRRPGRGGELSDVDADDTRHGRAGASLNDDIAAARRLRRQREEQTGRRSLTGLEFRRQRSI
jgi:hypothetical protein